MVGLVHLCAISPKLTNARKATKNDAMAISFRTQAVAYPVTVFSKCFHLLGKNLTQVMSNKNIPIKAGAWGKYRSGVVLGGWLIRRIELLDSHHWLQLPNYKKLPYIRLHPSPTRISRPMQSCTSSTNGAFRGKK